PISSVFNKCLKIGIFPNVFKIAIVLPLYKKDDVKDLNNYRPISLLPLISKIFEKLIYAQILTYLKTHNIINNSQFGFLENRSCDEAVSKLIELIVRRLDSSYKICLTIFLDM